MGTPARFALALILAFSLAPACTPRPRVLSPADGSYVAPPESGGVPVEINLSAAFGEGWSFRVTLLSGVDSPPASFLDLTADFSEAAGVATGEIDPADLGEGRNSLFVAIYAPGEATASHTASSSFSWEPNLAIETADYCDLLDSRVCLYPFPNDYFTVEDGGTDTGRRVRIDTRGTPANGDGIQIDTTELNRNDGWSPGNAIQVMIRGLTLQTPDPDPDVSRPVPAPGASPEWDQQRSLAPDASIVILDAATGERVPHWAELNERVAPNVRALLVRPAVNFRSGGRYLVALRNLRDGSGEIIPAERAFRIYRDGIPTYVPALEARRAHMEDILAALEAHGVPRDDLYLAWDFTVISKRNMSERMLAMRDDAFAQLGAAAPEFEVLEAGSGDAETRFRVRGRVEVPLYLTNGGETGGTEGITRLHCADGDHLPRPCVGDELPTQAWTCEDGEGAQRECAEGEAPTRPATYWADFKCTVPRSVQAVDGSAVPARPSLYGHGLLGTEGEAHSSHVRTFANEHNIVFCATRWIGMGEEDQEDLTISGILYDFSKFPTLADRLHQAMLNFLYLGRAMIHADGFGTDPAFQTDGGASILDGSNLYYDGNSQGAIAGGALAAFAQDYTRAVLGVPGMNYSTLLNRSVDFDDFRLFLLFNYPAQRNYPLMFGLAQMLWDRVETNGHANHLTSDTYADTPPKKILLHVGFGDFQVSDMSAQVEARTIGAHVHRPAFDAANFTFFGEPREFWQVNPYWNLPAIPPSAAAPVAGFEHLSQDPSYRFDGSALVVWDFGNLQSPNRNFPPDVMDSPELVPPELAPCAATRDGDPHECPRRDPRARLQKSEFMRPDGAVLDVCEGVACAWPPPDPI